MSKQQYQRIYPSPEAGVTLKGRWTLVHQRGDQVLKTIEGDNVVCTNGKEFLASFLYSASVAPSTFTCKYVAIGTDSTAEAAANTALGTELTRTTGTVSYVSNQVYQVTATFASGVGTGAIVEYGLLSSSTGGTLLSRDTEAVINKAANDTLTTIVRITVG
jgi:hypothetical protein